VNQQRRRILFVCRTESGESSRAAQALASLENVDVVTTDPDKLNEDHGTLELIVTAQETLLEAVAAANEQRGLHGIAVETVRRTLNKLQLKASLQNAGINTPRYELVKDPSDLNRFVAKSGFPIVLKSVAGSGALATLLLKSETDLERASELDRDLADFVVEEFIEGQELCIDTITTDNEPQFYSICCYEPSILEAVERPETQWRCVMPREMDDYTDFIAEGLKAIRALRVGNAMTHMEGFIDASGRPWFTDATLRPAGARIAPMLAHAYDIDPYRAWARVAVDGCFDGPWERKYAVGTIFLRGVGSGVVESVAGVDLVELRYKDLLVDARWPRIGAQKSVSYTGDGFITIRHPETGVVHAVLKTIGELVRVTYSSDSFATANWRERLYNFAELNRPAWDRAN
jgi:biotin carboxylase